MKMKTARVVAKCKNLEGFISVVSRGIGKARRPCFICGEKNPKVPQLDRDLSMFVQTKADGERLVQYFGGEKFAWLDYRTFEPNYIQVKIGVCSEHDVCLDLLDEFLKRNGSVLNEYLIKERIINESCSYERSEIILKYLRLICSPIWIDIHTWPYRCNVSLNDRKNGCIAENFELLEKAIDFTVQISPEKSFSFSHVDDLKELIVLEDYLGIKVQSQSNYNWLSIKPRLLNVLSKIREKKLDYESEFNSLKVKDLWKVCKCSKKERSKDNIVKNSEYSIWYICKKCGVEFTYEYGRWMRRRSISREYMSRSTMNREWELIFPKPGDEPISI